MIWPPSKAISIRTRSLLASGDHLRENAVHGVGMDERDLEAEQAFTRRVVDQVGSGALEFREGCPHVGDLVRDVMHPRAALRQEPPDRSVLAGWLEQLYPPLADAHRGRTHALLVDRGLVLDLGAKQPRIRGERLVEVIDGNAEVVDA